MNRRRLTDRPFAVAEHRNAQRLGLVGEVVGYARSGKHHDPDGQVVQHLVVAFERRGLGVPVPVGAICVTLRLSAQQAAMRSAPLGNPFQADLIVMSAHRAHAVAARAAKILGEYLGSFPFLRGSRKPLSN